MEKVWSIKMPRQRLSEPLSEVQARKHRLDVTFRVRTLQRRRADNKAGISI